MSERHTDVLIIGAGISGIGTACHLVRMKTGKSFTILDRRQRVGGTWDLFRYPGIHSDSDMLTFSFDFRPWLGTRTLADGASIRQYVEDTAKENGVFEHINFGRKVIRASWSTDDGLWTVEAVDEATGESQTYTARFLVGATGYYDYDEGYRPAFPGEERFGGSFVHPQHWPEDLDYAGKRVVVIGSGATAITLIPSMAGSAEHVTMLQRSPTYIVALPSKDHAAAGLRKLRLPENMVYRISRTRNLAIQRGFYQLARTQPAVARRLVLGWVRANVGSKVGMKHFTPSYNPWDQRLCVVPDGDLFKALKNGSASVVTDQIETFTESGIKLKSGEELPADIVVTATGLQLKVFGGVEIIIDGEPLKSRQTAFYKGVLVGGVPNMMVVLGYTNISWTLKADLVGEYFCRLLKHMDKHDYSQFVVRPGPEDIGEESVMGSSLTSGYIKRADPVLPRQGTRKPWKVLDDYILDAPMLRHGRIADDVLEFTDRVPAAAGR